MRCASVMMAAALLLAGCATGPSPQELANADYGEPISQQEAEFLAEEFLLYRLKDPDSAQFRWQPIHQGYIKHGMVYGGGVVYGYRLEGSVNARNSYGGYTGHQPYVFLFRNGQIETVYGHSRTSGVSHMVKIY